MTMCHLRVLFTNIFRRSNLLPVIEEDSSDNYLCLLLIKIGYIVAQNRNIMTPFPALNLEKNE